MTAERCVAALLFESLFQARPPHEEIECWRLARVVGWVTFNAAVEMLRSTR